MATQKQREAAKRNIKKAQATWKSMSHEEHARSQPQGRERQKPGTTGGGGYFRIQVRPKEDFVMFRTQDVGDSGHIQRLAGKRQGGSWATQTWLVSKEDAHVDDGTLVPDTAEARDLFERLGSMPVHVKGDIFKARDRPNVPERVKPTKAQPRARNENVKKAQAARKSRNS